MCSSGVVKQNKNKNSFIDKPVLHDWCIKDRGMCYLVCVAHVSAAGFLSRYLTGPLPYVRRHITVNDNVLSTSLNKTFPSFLHLLIRH